MFTSNDIRYAGRLALAAAVVFFMVADTQAQSARQKRHQQQQKQQVAQGPPIDLEGSFLGYRNGVIEIQNDLQGDEKWQCKTSQNTLVITQAEASKDFLQKGTFVSFQAEVNLKKGTIEQPISAITIFMPSAKSQPGVFLPNHASELFVSLDAMKLSSIGGGMGGGVGAMGMGMDSMMPADPGEKKSRKKEKPPESIELVVRGQIKSLAKNGALTLAVPANAYTKTSIKAKLTDEPVVDAVLTGPTVLGFAKKGDKVTTSGNQLTQFGPTAMQLTYMNVEFSGPLEKPSKKKAVKKTKDEDEDAAAAK